MIAHPFIKFVGGKTALLPEILPRLPAKINTYHEPFFGGGAVFFALAAEGRFKRAVIGDANKELMRTYETLGRHLDGAGGVVDILEYHTGVHNEEHYYEVRAQKPRELDLARRAARFIYLNRTCFNGLYRVNKKGEFNVPLGSYTNPKICDEANLRACAAILKKTAIASLDFEQMILSAKRGDAVYFDPPYIPVSTTANFTTYTAGGFSLADQTRLRDVAKDLVKRGVHVLLSNADTPLMRKLYRGFKIESVQAPRRVNSKASKRGNVGELLISGKSK